MTLNLTTILNAQKLKRMWTATISTILSVLLLIFSSLLPFFVLRRNICGLALRFIFSSLISLCNCFACGVFLATCFLGLIPHTKFNEDVLLQTLFPPNSTNSSVANFPLGKVLINTNLMVLVGILLMLLLEQLFAACYVGSAEGGHTALSQGVSPGHFEEGATPLNDAFYSKRSAKTISNFLQNENNHRSKTTAASQRSHRSEKPNRLAKGDFEPLVNLDDLLEADESSDDEMNVTMGEEEDDDFGSIEFRSCQESSKAKFNFGRHSHCPSSGTNEGGVLQMIMLLLAMSTHSVFEGIALGAQQSTEEFLRLLLSVMLHEVLCCFSYGISLSSQNVSLRTAILSTVLLAFSIPFGMAVMAFLGSFDGIVALILKFMLEGFSAGIFIFVACVEMLAPEFGAGHAHHGQADQSSGNSANGILKALVVCLGAFVAFVAGIWIRGM